MPAWTRGRLRTLIFLALLVVLLVVLASLIYFRAGPRAPEGADIVSGSGRAGTLVALAALGAAGGSRAVPRRRGLPKGRLTRHRAWAIGLLHDLKYLWALEAGLPGRGNER